MAPVSPPAPRGTALPGSAPAEGSAGAVVFGNFDLGERIGRGGMAEVFRAVFREGPRRGRVVALKRLLPQYAANDEYVDLFCAEADLSRMLEHPNVIQVLEAGSVGETYYMAMDFIDGRDVGQVLSRCRECRVRLPVDFAVFLAQRLLEALDYAHHATGPTGKPLNLVHCDVSPSNLFVSRTGEIKLGDFGIAKIRALDGHQRHGVWGKVHYASPELLRGEDPLPSADIWAAAVTLYELLTGERPFPGATVEEVAGAIVRADPAPPSTLRSDLPEPLERVLRMALHPDPRERFQDAGTFAAALGPLYDDRIGTPLAIAAVVRGLFGA
jgi:serine/threonine-protein kinase